MLLNVDPKTLQIISVDGRRLMGECDQCGACCKQNRPTCPHFEEGTFDGVKKCRCQLHGQNKPATCVLWPLPNSLDIPKECKLYYED